MRLSVTATDRDGQFAVIGIGQAASERAAAGIRLRDTVNLEISSTSVAEPLADFLSGVVGLELQSPILNFHDIPAFAIGAHCPRCLGRMTYGPRRGKCLV